MVDGDVRLTYAALAGRAASAASGLRARGVTRGARLALLAPNSAAFIEATFAADLAGAVLVPLNTRLAPAELAATCEDADARWLIASNDFADRVDALPEHGCRLAGVIWLGEPDDGRAETWAQLTADGDAEPDPAAGHPDGLAQLYYTSGTTGRPKGVMLTQANLRTHTEAAVAELGIGPDEVWAHVAPMFHLADAWASLAITAVGGRHVCLRRFSPERALALFERERISLCNLIPTMLNLMVKHPDAERRDLSGLRAILSGGAPIAPALVAQVIETFGCDYIQTYGMTETSPFLSLGLLTDALARLPLAERLAIKAKTGRPFSGVELRVVAEDGSPVAADGAAVGEIQVRGPTVTPGYWNQPGQTAAAFTPDGFLKTGDLATLDAHGFVNIVDRAKDMIVTGGENVYSTEVENVLYQHPAVLEAAVFGVPDERWGEAVCAAVVLKPGAQATAEELIRLCKQHLAGYKAPKRIDFTAGLPRTGSGKIAKRLLREAAED